MITEEGFGGDVARLVKAELRVCCKAWEKEQKAKRKNA